MLRAKLLIEHHKTQHQRPIDAILRDEIARLRGSNINLLRFASGVVLPKREKMLDKVKYGFARFVEQQTSFEDRTRDIPEWKISVTKSKILIKFSRDKVLTTVAEANAFALAMAQAARAFEELNGPRQAPEAGEGTN